MIDQRFCPEDGRVMERGVQRTKLTYKNRSLEVDLPGWYCPTCGESIHNGEDLKVSDRALTRLKAEAEGLLLPEEIRRIRKKLKLTQSEAGELIGGGPRAFQKYEAGELLPSRGTNTSLLLLDANPEALIVLREQRKQHAKVVGGAR